MSHLLASTAAPITLNPPTARGRRILNERRTARREQLLGSLLHQTIVPEDATQLTKEARSIYESFKPRNNWQDWLTREIAVLMFRINRCARVERRMRDYASYRAIEFWEEDQQVAVATLATRLDRDPERVVAQLRQTPSGCDWLLVRWRFLATIDPAAWTDAQRELAHLLTGSSSGGDPTIPGRAAEQVAELTDQRERVLEDDAIVRDLVESDLSDEAVPGLNKLRRYSRSLHRQMKWYIDQFHVEHPNRWDDPARLPGFEGRDALDREKNRRPNLSFFDPIPHQPTSPPQPTAPPPLTENDETKPMLPSTEADNEINETNPTPWHNLTPSLAAALPQPVVAEELAEFEATTASARSMRASRPTNPVRTATEKTRGQQRREAEQAIARSKRRHAALSEIGG